VNFERFEIANIPRRCELVDGIWNSDEWPMRNRLWGRNVCLSLDPISRSPRVAYEHGGVELHRSLPARVHTRLVVEEESNREVE
jgi:hypothetical protein